MSQTPCATNPNHGPATITFDCGTVPLCSACAHRRVVEDAPRHLPVGAVRGGQR